MRKVIAGAVLVAMLVLWPEMSSSHPGARATPSAATPLAEIDPPALATRVADLESTVAALQVTQITLDLEVDELEQSLALLLEDVPEQAVTIAFLQSQIDDLRVRMDELEARLTPTPAESDAHPLVGQWTVTDITSGAGAGLITFTADGIVVVLSPAGSTAVGVWEPTGPRSAIAVWIFPESGGRRQAEPVALQVRIAIDPAGGSIRMSYQVVEVTARGSVAEQGDGVVTGRRVATPTPAVESTQSSGATVMATPAGS